MKQRGEKSYEDCSKYFAIRNPYIMGLYCECESARAELAINTEVKDADSVYRKVMGLSNIKEVLFQGLLLDDIWEKDTYICAKLYTVYLIDAM